MADYLFCDNVQVGRTKWGAYFLSIWIDEERASITRYCVPGRIDTYSFSWVPGNGAGVGDRVTFFTDCNPSTTLDKAVKLVKKDLKRPAVKELLVQAKVKVPKWPRHLDYLLESLR